MDYLKLAKIYEALEVTSKRLEKTKIISGLLKEIKAEELTHIVYLIQGRVFPPWDQRELGISSQLTLKIISKATGTLIEKVTKLWKQTGDLGIVAEELTKEKKQVTLEHKKLTTEKVFENLQKVAELTGKGTVERKVSLVSELVSHASPLEAKFLIRTVLGELRIGVADGVIRDAIAQAYNIDINLVERAINLLADYAEVAQLAKKGKKSLEEISLVPGTPIKVMLAIRVESFEEAFEALGKPTQLEWKLDGFRVQIHKKDKKITLFTRRLENVTKQFSEIIPILEKNVKSSSYILDSELVGYNQKTGTYLPFQMISQRIKRKYDIEKIAREFPVEINIFDIVCYNGKSLINKSLKERRAILEKIIHQIPRKIVLTKKLITDDAKKAQVFYKEALKHGVEGVMIKNINSNYVSGRHVGGWIKLKPIMETLDLVITGAQWGEGKRAKWLSSFTLSCYDPKKDKFIGVGKVGTGIKEKAEGVTFEYLTKILKSYITKTEGKVVQIKPKVVVEVAYEEIQKSPTYESGLALRFPRILRERPEKSPEDVDTIEKINKLFKSQKKK